MTESNEFNVDIIKNKGADLYAELEPELARLHNDNITLLMATVDNDNIPHASYTPFALVNNNYYIFIADIASHTQHIKDRPIFDIMIIDDESNTKNIYARKRVTYQVEAQVVPENHPDFEKGIAALTERAGKTVNVLKGLGDFHLFRLLPRSGTLVTGFGKAFRINPKDITQTTHLTGNGGKGHGKSHGIPKQA